MSEVHLTVAISVANLRGCPLDRDDSSVRLVVITASS